MDKVAEQAFWLYTNGHMYMSEVKDAFMAGRASRDDEVAALLSDISDSDQSTVPWRRSDDA